MDGIVGLMVPSTGIMMGNAMRGWRTIGTWVAMALAFAVAPLAIAAPAPAAAPADRTRIVILSDIGNEPDDSESFVRFLLYADQFDVEGLIATTSTWQRDRVQPALIAERIDAYARVRANLLHHAQGYPEPSALRAVLRSGRAAYGMAGVGEGQDSDASRLLITAVDRADARPLWVSVWGGAVDLAQALWHVRATRSPAEVDRFVSRLRVYAISDQDDAGPWIRRTFPQLFWIGSVHGWKEYSLATWNGISGDLMRPEMGWPDADMVSNDWIDRYIRRGPLGLLYPRHSFLMEGDSPAFLYLLRTGLGDRAHPEQGSWGGRYTLSDPSAGHYGDAADRFVDDKGKPWRGNQATIFRWRAAMQNDFAARIGWTLTPDVRKANHPPIVLLNAAPGDGPLHIAAQSGDSITLSAQGSRDPDGDALAIRWWHYPEPSAILGLQPLAIADASNVVAHVTAPAVTAPTDLHFIVEVRDSGTPALTRYRRAIVTVRPRAAKDQDQ